MPRLLPHCRRSWGVTLMSFLLISMMVHSEAPVYSMHELEQTGGPELCVTCAFLVPALLTVLNCGGAQKLGAGPAFVRSTAKPDKGPRKEN